MYRLAKGNSAVSVWMDATRANAIAWPISVCLLEPDVHVESDEC